MNNGFMWEAHSKYPDRCMDRGLLQSLHEAIVLYGTRTFAPEQKIVQRGLTDVFFEKGRVGVESQMSQKLTLVLMAGLPCAGKSTVAQKMSKDLDWALVDKDDYKDKHLKQGLDDDTASYYAYEEAFTKVRSTLIEHRKSVILDCVGLHDFILEEVISIVRSSENVQLKVILCVVDPGLRKERLRKRPPQRVVINEDLETDADYFKIYKLPEHDTLILHTDKLLGEQYENRTIEECLIETKKHLGVLQYISQSI